MKRSIVLFVFAFLFAFASVSYAAEFPTGPINCLVGYSAGGGSDRATRMFGEYYSKELNAPFVVNNVPGGSGTVAVSQLKSSKADGYTIGLVNLSSLSVSPFVLDLDYTIDDFKFIGAFCVAIYAVMVPADSPYKTFDDIVAAAKSGTIKLASTGANHNYQISRLSKLTGGDFQAVYYPNTTDAVTDVLSSRIDGVVSDIGSFGSYVEAGQIRVIVSTSSERWPLAPDVPTAKELGLDIDVKSAYGLAVPKDTPDDVVKYLRDKFEIAVKNEDYAKRIYDGTKNIYMAVMGDEIEKEYRDMYKSFEEFFKDNSVSM